MKQNTLNKILATILIIESLFVAGLIGYRLGEAKTTNVYVILEIDPSTIDFENIYKGEDNPEPAPEIKFEQASDKYIEPSYTEEEVGYIAKTVWGEARGLPDMEKSAVIWAILNRLDDGRFGSNIADIVEAPKQFAGYNYSNPIDSDIRNLVIDVLDRYELEKSGVENVGRVLPKGYLYFRGDGHNNLFTKVWNSNDIWNWSLPNPYE